MKWKNPKIRISINLIEWHFIPFVNSMNEWRFLCLIIKGKRSIR